MAGAQMNPKGPKAVLDGALALAKAAADKPLGELQSERERRHRRRRVNLSNLNFALRENARLYNALVNGDISPQSAEAQSAHIMRHFNILEAIAYQQKLDAIQTLMRGGLPPEFDPDVPDKLS